MASGCAVPSDLFPLVLAFLRENHFDGAARAFGKAAGVTEQDPNAASLLDIFNYWLKSPVAKKQQAFANGSSAKKTKRESSSYESSSEDETPAVRKQATKQVTVPPVPIKAAHGSSESSSDDTSDSTDSEQEEKKPAKKGIVLQGKKSTIQKTRPQKTSKSSSSDSSNSEDETPKDQTPKSEGAPKVAKLASTSAAKHTKMMSKTSNGKAEGSSSSDETGSSEDSSSEEDQPVKDKLKKVPHCQNNAVQPLPVKTKHLKKSSSSEHEKLASKPKRGEYCAAPPPLAIESRKGKAQRLVTKTSKKKREDSEKKEQVSTKRPSTEGSTIKKTFASKSLPVSIQNGDTSSESDSDSSSEEDKNVLVRPSAKVISANGAAKLASSKKVTSSSDSSDSDSSDSIPKKSAVRTGIKKVKKLPGVLAKKAESSFEVKKVPKKKIGMKALKTTPKSSIPVSKPKSSESSSEEEQNQPAQKSTSKLSMGSSRIVSKQGPADSRTSSDSSSDEQFKIPEKRERKRIQNSCGTEKKAPKISANFVGKTSASKNPASEVLNTAKSSSSDEEATKGGISKKKRKRKDDQELETPDIKKMKPRSPHTFPKTKQQSSPFRRIRAEEVEIDVRVANNSFDAKELQVTGVKKQMMF
ncbi:nucleolar and coiled-body phosphoprotein 1 isoform 4-T4 [Liasis olivaceus]